MSRPFLQVVYNGFERIPNKGPYQGTITSALDKSLVLKLRRASVTQSSWAPRVSNMSHGQKLLIRRFVSSYVGPSLMAARLWVRNFDHAEGPRYLPIFTEGVPSNSL